MASNLSRRSFVGGAAAAAVGVAGIASGAASATEGGQEPGAQPSATADVWKIEDLGEPAETLSADVVVVGAGGTGLAAGIQAKQLGLDVIVLEKHSFTGGSFIGTEGLFAVGSHWQEEAGETTTAADIIEECMTYHHWLVDYDLYRSFFDKTAETIDWLESIGVEFDHVQSLGDSHVCWHIYKGSSTPGVEFMQSMAAAAEEAGVRIELECSGKKVLTADDGSVAGVLAVRGDGSVVRIDAPAVIIGTGGYSNNKEIVSYLTGLDEDFLMPTGVNGRDGDGIKMGLDAGGTLADAPGTMMFYGPVPKGSAWENPLCAAALQPILWLNEKAERYTREDMFLKNFPFAGCAMRKQKKVWAVLNQAMVDRFETGEGALTGVGVWVAAGQKLEGLQEEIDQILADGEGHAVKADTLEGLAEATGLDAASLQKTIDTYNGFCEEGFDEDFHKPGEYLLALTEDGGPYYAFDCQDAYFTTCGGLEVDTATEVLRADGTPVPGLYAGGCDTGGFYGDAYDAGIAAGSGASWAINSGRIAAQHAAEYLGK